MNGVVELIDVGRQKISKKIPFKDIDKGKILLFVEKEAGRYLISSGIEAFDDGTIHAGFHNVGKFKITWEK